MAVSMQVPSNTEMNELIWNGWPADTERQLFTLESINLPEYDYNGHVLELGGGVSIDILSTNEIVLKRKIDGFVDIAAHRFNFNFIGNISSYSSNAIAIMIVKAAVEWLYRTTEVVYPFVGVTLYDQAGGVEFIKYWSVKNRKL